MECQKMRQSYLVGIIFFISVFLRFLLGNFYPKTINCYPDEMLYLSLGESLWNHHDIQVFNAASSFKKMAYPLLIAPAFAFGEVKMQGTIIALINSVLMSLGVFPVYGLAKRILTQENHILFCAILNMISPTMTFSMTYMSENLAVPLSILLIYIVYRMWEEERMSRKIFFGGVAVGVMIWCYVAKSIALVFPVALVMMVLTQWVFGKDRKERIWAIVIGSAVLVVGIWLGYTRFLPADIMDKSGYALFGFLFFAVISVLGFCVLPVLIPGMCYSKMDEKAKRLYLFLVYTLIVTAVVVACLIYTSEDYPSLTPRAHLRYVEYLFVPFVMLLLQVIERDASLPSRISTWGIFSVWAVMLLGVFRGFSGQTIDQTMLFYWQLIAKEGREFSTYSVRLMSLLIIVVVAALIVTYGRNRKVFGRVITLGLVVMCVGNSALSVYVQYKTHTHTEAETAEMEQLREFVCEHQEANFLVLEPPQYCEMIDTFLIDCDNVRTGTEPVMTQEEWTFEPPTDITYAVVCEQGYQVAADAKCIMSYPNLGYSLYEIKEDRILEE